MKLFCWSVFVFYQFRFTKWVQINAGARYENAIVFVFLRFCSGMTVNLIKQKTWRNLVSMLVVRVNFGYCLLKLYELFMYHFNTSSFFAVLNFSWKKILSYSHERWVKKLKKYCELNLKMLRKGEIIQFISELEVLIQHYNSKLVHDLQIQTMFVCERLAHSKSSRLPLKNGIFGRETASKR